MAQRNSQEKFKNTLNLMKIKIHLTAFGGTSKEALRGKFIALNIH